MTKKELETYYNFFSELWKLFKKYSIPASKSDCSVEFWHEFDNEAVDLYHYCNDASFAKNIILTMMDEVDRISHGKPMQTDQQVEADKQCA